MSSTPWVRCDGRTHDISSATGPPSPRLDLFVGYRRRTVALPLHARERVLALDELVLDGVTDQSGVVRQPELLEDPGAVGADRARTEIHFRGYLIDLLARGEQPHHPVLAVRQGLVQRLLPTRGE